MDNYKFTQRIELLNIDFKQSKLFEYKLSEEDKCKVNKFLELLDHASKQQSLSLIYINQIDTIIYDLQNHFHNAQMLFDSELQHIQNYDTNQLSNESKENIKNLLNTILKIVEEDSFILNFFDSIDYLNSNIVGVGANGSGKTSLINYLSQFTHSNFITITAQKILSIQTNQSLRSLEAVTRSQNDYDHLTKDFKSEFLEGNSISNAAIKVSVEFNNLLAIAFAKRSLEFEEYIEKIRSGEKDNPIPHSLLDRCLDIWSEFIPHRKLEVEGWMNLKVKIKNDTNEYKSNSLSEGEKVILYYLIIVLMAPEKSFIFIDEPEMFLHKSILNKLWDRIELEREDCKFIYLTHDLDFASDRQNSKKIWIKSFNHPDKWEIEKIPNNEIPEALLMELLGNRKPILFCESTTSKEDYKIYSSLFPNLYVKPVEYSKDVINYTKAFNKIENINRNAIGLIDRDFRIAEQLQNLELNNVFAIEVAEIENLLLTDDFLKLFFKDDMFDTEGIIKNIQNEVIADFKNDLEKQISNYVSERINFLLKERNLHQKNTIIDVQNQFKEFIEDINIEKFYSERKAELEMYIEKEDYSNILKVFNNKGLKKAVKKFSGVDGFMEKAIRLITSNNEARTCILKHLPEALISKLN